MIQYNPNGKKDRLEYSYETPVKFSNFRNKDFNVETFRNEIQHFFDKFKYKQNEDTDRFSLQSQQKFVPTWANYKTYGEHIKGVNSRGYGSLLVYHALGSGKTCTSIIAGEVYKEYIKIRNQKSGLFRKIIYVAPKSVQESLKEDIGGKIVEKDGERYLYAKCPQSVRFNRSEKRAVAEQRDLDFQKAETEQAKRIGKTYRELLTKKREEKIQKDWLLVGPKKFSNLLVNNNDDTLSELSYQLYQGHNLIIIDEVQNIISTNGVYYDRISKILHLLSRKNIIILMSATPVYDKPIEIGLTFNLLNPRVYFPREEDTFNDIFFKRISRDSDKLRKVTNQNLFKWMATGYVSYFSGGDPNNFPKKRIIDINHKMKSDQDQNYQTEIMNRIRNLRLHNLSDNSDDSKLLLSNILKPRQISNVGQTIGNNNYLPEIYNNSTKISWIINRVTPKTLAENIKKLNNNYSNGYAEGKVLIFSDMIPYGIDIFCQLLTFIGFEEVSDTTDISIEKPRFIIWKGSTDSVKVRKYVNLFNETRPTNPEMGIYNNNDGKRIKIIIGSRTIMEGVSFTNIKDVHILEPWWNESRIDQIIARSVRFNSHASLREEERFVNVFRHHAVMSSFPEENEDLKEAGRTITTLGLHKYSVDTYLRMIAENKRNTRRIFERLLKECSIDCELNSQGHNVQLVQKITQINNIKVQDDKKDFVSKCQFYLYYENPTTGQLYIDNSKSHILSFEEIENLLKTFEMPSGDNLIKAEMIYDENDNAKFGNRPELIPDTVEGSIDIDIDNNGIFNEGILCDKDLTLNSEEKKELNKLISTTCKIQKLQDLFRAIHYKAFTKIDRGRKFKHSSEDYTNNLTYLKKKLIKAVLSCISDERKRILYKELYQSSKQRITDFSEKTDMDDIAKELYDQFKQINDYEFLIKFGNKNINVLQYICQYPDAKLDLVDEEGTYWLYDHELTKKEYNLLKSVIAISKLRRDPIIGTEVGREQKVISREIVKEQELEPEKKIFKRPRRRFRPPE